MPFSLPQIPPWDFQCLHTPSSPKVPFHVPRTPWLAMHANAIS